MRQLIHNSKLGNPNGTPPLASAFRIPHSAFTLVELLIVIAIIAVLATMSVSMLSGASNDAKISATQARLSQITAILQLQMEDYEVRRLPISNRILAQYVAANRMLIDGGQVPKNDRLQLKYLRRQLLMALIDSEMPRPVRALDVAGTIEVPISYVENEQAGQFGSTTSLVASSDYVQSNIAKNIGEFGDPQPSFAEWVGGGNYGNPPTINGTAFPRLIDLLNNVTSGGAKKFQRQVEVGVVGDELDLPGEYLHEILRSIQIDGQSAVELLGNSAISNTDDDSYPEVVDAWGDPLIFDIEQVGSTVVNNVVRSNDIGIVPLDPRYPKALGELRITVGSVRIPETLPEVERIALGVAQ